MHRAKEKRSTISIADLHLDRRLAGTCGRGHKPRAGCSPPPTVVPAKGEATPIAGVASGGSASILRDTFAPRSAGPRTQCASLGHSVQRMDCSPSDAGPLAGAPIDEYPSAVASGWCRDSPHTTCAVSDSLTQRFSEPAFQLAPRLTWGGGGIVHPTIGVFAEHLVDASAETRRCPFTGFGTFPHGSVPQGANPLTVLLRQPASRPENSVLLHFSHSQVARMAVRATRLPPRGGNG